MLRVEACRKWGETWACYPVQINYLTGDACVSKKKIVGHCHSSRLPSSGLHFARKWVCLGPDCAHFDSSRECFNYKECAHGAFHWCIDRSYFDLWCRASITHSVFAARSVSSDFRLRMEARCYPLHAATGWFRCASGGRRWSSEPASQDSRQRMPEP